jgi:hypothetical protein
MKAGPIYVGTSGWSYKSWAEAFYSLFQSYRLLIHRSVIQLLPVLFSTGKANVSANRSK